LQTYRVPTSFLVLCQIIIMPTHQLLFNPDYTNCFKDKRLEKRGFSSFKA